jgi:uncharacterized protein (DUF1800 family)
VGVGNYAEADVHAAAAALTGWVVRPREQYAVSFVPGRHDATPRTLFGAEVRDVGSVVDAAVRNPACATFVAAKLAAWFLGPGYDTSIVPGLAATFRDGDHEIAPLVRAILRAGLDGRGSELVLAPVPWFVAARKALDVSPDVRVVIQDLSSAGQEPLLPPNVGGWPGPAAWLGASATAMRVSLATALVDQLPVTSPVAKAAAAGDLATLAVLLGLPNGFAAPTRDALAALVANRPGGRAGAAVASVALASPDVLVA